jgi:hypothetical protein
MICSALSGVRSGRAGSISLAQLGEATNKHASKGAIAFLILLGAAFAWGYQPLLPIYPAEVLSTEMRSTGFGLLVLVLNISSE